MGEKSPYEYKGLGQILSGYIAIFFLFFFVFLPIVLLLLLLFLQGRGNSQKLTVESKSRQLEKTGLGVTKNAPSLSISALESVAA